LPTGPKGQKRLAEVIGNAVRVMRIATGDEADDVIDDGKNAAAKELGSKGGKKRAANMTPERRAEIARDARNHKFDSQDVPLLAVGKIAGRARWTALTKLSGNTPA